MRVHILDRILDSDDVTIAVGVTMTDHGRQGGGLTRTRTADHEYQATLVHHDLLEHRRQFELLDGRDVGVDGTQHRAREPLLHEGIDAEASNTLGADGEVALLVGIEVAHLAIVHDRTHQDVGLLARQRLRAHRRHASVDLAGRGKSGGDEEIGPILLHHLAQTVEHEICGLLTVHNAPLMLGYDDRR